MKIGFTGTRQGLTPYQKTRVGELLILSYSGSHTEFHHGDAIGADVQAADIARKIGYRIVAYPGFPPHKPADDRYRGYYASDEIRDPEAFLVRDHKIVQAVDRMLGCPAQREEILRSGTWATIRYARSVKKPLDIIYPQEFRNVQTQ